jgi:ATP-dependent helicase/nuclease subunit A
LAQWTKEQLEVIASRGKNQLVSAAAGSGKTAVLITRILCLIKEGLTSVDRLLVVTFTKAAASEMKERLHLALNQELEKTIEETDMLRQQISALPKAQISTIHAFCKEVILDHFQVLGIDPNFKVGNGSELEKLQDAVMDHVFEAAYKTGDPDFYETLACYTKAKSDAPLREWVKKIYGFARTHVNPEQFLEEVKHRYGDQADSFWRDQLSLVLMSLMEGLLEAYEKSMSEQREKNLTFYLEAFQRDYDVFAFLYQQLKEDVASFQTAFMTIEYDRLPVLSKKRKEAFTEEELSDLEALKDYRNELKDFVKKRISIYCLEPIDDQIRDLKTMAPKINTLVLLVQRYSAAFNAKKIEKAMLDFSDLEHFTISLLNQPDICKVYQERFDFVFTDEYQDSNRVQEYILSRVSQDNNRFMVGDLKQSIYKFRLADPTLFIDTYKAYEKAGDSSEKHDLNKNFRSAATVIDFVNACFKPLMRENFGGIAYDEANQLYPGATFDFQVPVVVRIIDRERQKDTGEDVAGDMPEKVYAEALEAAEVILSLVGKAYYYDAKAGVPRLIQFSDIVILLRSAQQAATIYRDVFFEKQIPLYTESQTGYFAAVEVEIFVNFLRLIDNITLELPLMTTMRSMIGGFSLEDLMAIRFQATSPSFYEAVITYMTEESDDLANRLKAFMAQLNGFQALSKQLSLDTFIWRLFLATPFYDSLGALYQGENKQANLRLLINRAEAYLGTERTSLHGFLSHMDELKRKEVDFSEARLIHEKDNVVKLMTIHKSKGLEFPVVILGGLGKNFNEMDLRDSLILHEAVGLSTAIINPVLRYKKSALSERIVKYRLRREMLEEELRILYVAMTRAIHRLILIGSVRSVDKAISKWNRPVSGQSLFGVSSLLDFVMTALRTSVLDEDDLYRWIEEGQLSMIVPIQMTLNLINLEPLEMQRQKKHLALSETDFMKHLASADLSAFNGFQTPYPYETAVTLPLKISVTEYKNMRKSLQNDVYHVPELRPLTVVEPLGGAVRGTQIHSILEHFQVPYTSFETTYEQTKAYLLEKGLVTSAVLETIALEDLRSFFESSVGLRMQQALAYHREQPFVLQLEANALNYQCQAGEKVLLQGVIDLYFEEADGLVLIDYKSDQLTLDQMSHWNDRYKLTLDLYTQALETLKGKKVKERYIYSTHNRAFLEM